MKQEVAGISRNRLDVRSACHDASALARGDEEERDAVQGAEAYENVNDSAESAAGTEQSCDEIEMEGSDEQPIKTADY
jgi:hypothetical protein